MQRCGAKAKILSYYCTGRIVHVPGPVLKRTVSTAQHSDALDYPSCQNCLFGDRECMSGQWQEAKESRGCVKKRIHFL